MRPIPGPGGFPFLDGGCGARHRERVIAARSEAPRLHGLVILVVEDHQDSRELAVQILLHEGALVLAAHDGRAALRTLETRIPDVILSDLLMPGPDGLAFARRVKADADRPACRSSR